MEIYYLKGLNLSTNAKNYCECQLNNLQMQS